MDEIQLQPVPELPEVLREAAFRGKLIPFVGAGVSKLAGCPTWDELADECLRSFVPRGLFSHAQLDQIKSLRPRIKLSIARGLQQLHKADVDFRKLIHPTPRQENEKGRRLYASLSRLSSVFVTTNYDEWLDEDRAPALVTSTGEESAQRIETIVKRHVYYKSSELTVAHLNQSNTVLHLHGSVKDPAGMILSTSDYVDHYRNDRTGQENPVLTFLESMFKDKYVLFLGYGLDELEILEYIILKSREFKVEGLQSRHFMVQGFFSHEHQLMLSLKGYYDQFGIGLLPYLKDQKGWDQLVDVVVTCRVFFGPAEA